MKFVALLNLALTATASLVPRSDPDPSRYTICGADRGYTEADSLAAKDYLLTKIIRSDSHPLEKNECAYAHVNTTIVSICNGSARDRTVNRGEVSRGVEELIKVCGLEGGFTGIHVVNNLTFSAYGITGTPPPIGTPKSKKRTPVKLPSVFRKSASGRQLAKRACEDITYDGKSLDACDPKFTIENGVCGDPAFVDINTCQIFCEQTQTGFYGPEDRASGKSGERSSPNIKATIVASTEYSVSNGFSISVEGVAKEVIGAGVTYTWSSTTTTGTAIERTAEEVSDKYFSRWVFLPKLIESCGTVGQMENSPPAPCGEDICEAYGCEGDMELIENVCSIVPKLNDAGEPEVDWAVRFEDEKGNPAPFDEQPASYRRLCQNEGGDPDNDGDKECFNHMPAKRNFELEDRLARDTA
ncbi:hypothetical protein QBC35DRAFT_457355 [Podospora australis]|uniref:Uncharacterized protein n=1 Tax=Podospora australis TaxID=1536484 RepID=A0AAN7ABC4_9PEZI|nr:hypothetical protein QBC35DRAFT_457355 [Podospora australis]